MGAALGVSKSKRGNLLISSSRNEDKYAALREHLCSPPPSPRRQSSSLDKYHNSAYSCAKCRDIGVYHNTLTIDESGKPSVCNVCDKYHCNTHASYYHRRTNEWH
jgi:hypothetical protein